MIQPIVSILIPAYNAERWIDQSIQSALDQTWPRKELIVIDDGSTDATCEAAARYSSSIVKVVRQDNSGAAAARNSALSLAQGDFVQWLDADDLLAPDKITRQMRAMQRKGDPSALYSARFAEFFVDNRSAKFTPTVLWQDLEAIDFLCINFTQNAYFPPHVWLASRQLTDLAGPWKEDLGLDDDGEYFSRVVAASRRVYHVPEACVYYRRGISTSLSRSTSDRAARSLVSSLGYRIGHLLALEDSNRTRSAGLTLLQTTVDLWWSLEFEEASVAADLEQLAARLGGRLRPRRRNWKFEALSAMVGPATARRTRILANNGKLRTRALLEHSARLVRPRGASR